MSAKKPSVSYEMNKEQVIKALEELRKQNKRKFNQSVDLLINLKSFDTKKDSVNLFLQLPHKIKERKICAFLNKKSSFVDSITKADFESYVDKKKMKKLVKEYDFFIAEASLMPLVAKTFGRFLGAAGKMPSPQLGVFMQANDEAIKKMIADFDKTIRIKSKEPSLKFSIGKESMKNEEIAENILKAFETIQNSLPKQKENIRNVMIKLTMGEPVKIE